MNSWSRTKTRNIWLASVAVLFGAALASYQYASSARSKIDETRLDLDAAYRELDNVKRLSASLSELDRQTINENTATRLEILRHLEMERSNYGVNIVSRQEQQVGSSTLYVRTVEITVNLPYQALLTLADRLHNTGRLVLSQITLNTDVSTANNDDNTIMAPDVVHMVLRGSMYGIQKKEVGRAETPQVSVDTSNGTISPSVPIAVDNVSSGVPSSPTEIVTSTLPGEHR